MPLPPYETLDEEEGKVFSPGKFLLIGTAVGSWGALLLIAAEFMAKSDSDSFPQSASALLMCYLAAGGLSLLGSLCHLFAVSKKYRRENWWVRYTALANYVAFLAVILTFFSA